MVLCLVMLLASEENLLRLYKVILPAMALVLTNFAITQRFVASTRPVEPLPPPPPADWWSQLVSCLSGIVEYFLGKDDAPVAAEVEDASHDCFRGMFYVMSVTIPLVLASGLIHFVAVGSSTVERIAVATLVNLFVVPCFLKLAGGSQSDVELANQLACRTVCLGMELWSTVSLERMLYASVRSLSPNGVAVGWMLVELWRRVRRPLFVSWLAAFAAQLVDSLLDASADVSDLTYAEVTLSSLRHGSRTPMMYLGLCSAVSYVTDAAWRLVYAVVARSAARHSVTDDGLTELLTLVHARLLCLLLGISAAEMFSFIIPYLTGLLTVRWICRGVKAQLMSDDRRTRVAACVVYLVVIGALPCLVVLGAAAAAAAAKKRNYLAGNLFIALRFSVAGASTLVQSLVRRRSATTDDGTDDSVFVIRVSK